MNTQRAFAYKLVFVLVLLVSLGGAAGAQALPPSQKVCSSSVYNPACTVSNDYSVNRQDLYSISTRVVQSSTLSTDSWLLTGNSGITGTNFLGTTDNIAVTLKVSNTVALRLIHSSPFPFPSVIGGSVDNYLFPPDVYGATIAGGYKNGARGTSATVGGGWDNTAGQDATVAGGRSNNASNAGNVGGGAQNSSTGIYADIGGGINNVASGDAATVSGGGANEASGPEAAIGGGGSNNASGNFGVVPGGFNNSAQATIVSRQAVGLKLFIRVPSSGPIPVLTCSSLIVMTSSSCAPLAV